MGYPQAAYPLDQLSAGFRSCDSKGFLAGASWGKPDPVQRVIAGSCSAEAGMDCLAGGTHAAIFSRRAHLVPSFSFGENELFRQVVFKEGSWMRNLQERCRKLLGFAPCLFYGRGLTSIHSRGFLPFPRPITTVGEFFSCYSSQWGWPSVMPEPFALEGLAWAGSGGTALLAHADYKESTCC